MVMLSLFGIRAQYAAAGYTLLQHLAILSYMCTCMHMYNDRDITRADNANSFNDSNPVLIRDRASDFVRVYAAGLLGERTHGEDLRRKQVAVCIVVDGWRARWTGRYGEDLTIIFIRLDKLRL